ncbi:hypothetical protein BC827DRAFT_1130468, partial [Russula dissimulans]
IAPFGDAYEKIGTIQRRLAWPLHKDDTLFQSGRPTGLNIYFYVPFFSHFSAVVPFKFSYPSAAGTAPYPSSFDFTDDISRENCGDRIRWLWTCGDKQSS